MNCKRVELTPQERTKTLAIDPLEGISAACFTVDWHGFKDLVMPSAEVIGPDARLLDQLHLGTAYYYDRRNETVWTCYQNRGLDNAPKPWCNGKGYQTTGSSPGLYAKKFGVDFLTYTGSGEVQFIISNVAVKPWETIDSFTPGGDRSGEPRFRIGIEVTEGEATLGPPARANERGPGRQTPSLSRAREPATLTGISVPEFDTPSPDREAQPIYNWAVYPRPGQEMSTRSAESGASARVRSMYS